MEVDAIIASSRKCIERFSCKFISLLSQGSLINYPDALDMPVDELKTGDK